MKNITMIGALWTSNFGDVLLADLLYKKAKEVGFKVRFYNVSEKVLNELNAENATFKELINSDYLMFIAGGYLSEPPSNVSRWALSRYKKIFMYADIFKLLGKKYYIVDVGAGAIENPLSKFILKRFVENAEDVILRDSKSLETFKNLGSKKDIKLSIDYALSISNNKEHYATNEKREVALHLSSHKPKLNDYILKYFDNANYDTWFIEDHFGEYEKIKNLNPQIEKILKNKIIRYTNYENFIKTLNSFDFILTSKLHVGILSSALNKKICSFPYHGKVINYYKEVGYSDLCCENILNEEDCFKHLKYCLNSDPVHIKEDILKRLEIVNNLFEDIK
ncbi:polysaccharide pyruvyl transferase family protein [Arcobacter arenosus]|uniref:Polysaccharide pyruvyl transferase family protein n=1 Tax=Arcobacter arenosus TaxID=2576037 RepID=A0A5R8XYZ2_9BACT|nr:polysaccharide pyruvyl transferase family protein [Arcobacter arenosus]TLP36817.1 polysaccharide pyruvyl transferase family protein [Arcobacter arenosus]